MALPRQCDKLHFILPHLLIFANKKENPPQVFPGRCYKSRFQLHMKRWAACMKSWACAVSQKHWTHMGWL